MTAQGSIFKVFSSFNAYRSILTNSFRIGVGAPQLNAGIKQSSADKILKEKLASLNFPQKPRRPLTPYFRFLSEHRSLVKEEHPELNMLALVKRCAEDWKNVHSTIKERYTELYKKEMEDYSKKYLDYMAKLTDEHRQVLSDLRKKKLHDRERRSLRRRYKETGRPKRPVGPYFIFLAEKAKERNQKYNELATSINEEWNNLNEGGKQKYRDIYSEHMKQYENDMKIWESNMIKEGNLDVVRGSAIIKKDAKIKSPRKSIPKNEE